MGEFEPGVYVVEKRIILHGEKLELGDIRRVISEKNPPSKHPKPKTDHESSLEERVNPKIESSRRQPILVIEEKDRTGKEFATTFDIKGVPIIKLKYSERGLYSPTDGREQRIASLEVISNGSVSFVNFNNENFIQSNFSLTEKGYDILRNFLLTYGRSRKKGRRVKSSAGKDIVGNLGSYNYLLKSNGFLIIQCLIDSLKYDSLKWDEQRKVGLSVSKTRSLKPVETTQEFNSYAYEALVKTYEKFENAFFNKN